MLYYGAITLHVHSQLFPYPELALAVFVKITYFRRVCVCVCVCVLCVSVWVSYKFVYVSFTMILKAQVLLIYIHTHTHKHQTRKHTSEIRLDEPVPWLRSLCAYQDCFMFCSGRHSNSVSWMCAVVHVFTSQYRLVGKCYVKVTPQIKQYKTQH